MQTSVKMQVSLKGLDSELIITLTKKKLKDATGSDSTVVVGDEISCLLKAHYPAFQIVRKLLNAIVFANN